MNSRLMSVIAGLCLICLPACGASPEELITKALDDRKQGFMEKDIDLYMSTVSPDYNNEGETYANIKQKTAGYFSTFEKIELEVHNRSIYIDGDKAQVVEKFTLTFSLSSGKNMGKGEQKFILRKEDGSWKITGGLGSQS